MSAAARIFLALTTLVMMCGCRMVRSDEQTLTFLHLNVWEDLVNLKGGADETRQAFYDVLCEVKPDVATFCELNSSEEILSEAAERLSLATGKRYFYTYRHDDGGRGTISCFPVVEQGVCPTSEPGRSHNGWLYCTVIDFHGQQIAVYASHSYYAHYACYLPRGYDGNLWTEMDAPVTDVAKILEEENLSGRQYIGQDMVADFERQKQMGRLCIFAGDLNQPSCLDWTSRTADMYAHNGCVVDWPISRTVSDAGIIDAWRKVWPDETTHYGITWPCSNPDAAKPTSWASTSDDRDRIDYVYYCDDDRIDAVEARLVGPSESVSFNMPVKDVTDSREILVPSCKWPSDHRGVLVRFRIIAPRR